MNKNVEGYKRSRQSHKNVFFFVCWRPWF